MEQAMAKNYFSELYNVNVSDKIEKKNGLSYVSWPFAWAEVKKRYPDANYTIYERSTEFGPVNYFTDGRTCWVKTGVTVNGIEHIEELPVMDFKNRSITYDQITSMDANKSIQRSLTKALARHGLGLYVYAGEDLPEDETDAKKGEAKQLKPELDTSKKAAPNKIELIKKNVPQERINAFLNKFGLERLEDADVMQLGIALNVFVKEGYLK